MAISPKKLSDRTAITISKSAYGNKLFCKSLRNSHLKCRRSCNYNLCNEQTGQKMSSPEVECIISA